MAATHTHRIARLETAVAAQGEALNRIIALLEGDAPAKTARKAPAKKAPAKRKARKAPAKPATKGAQTRATLSRKEFNRTVTTKARLAGGDTYKRVMGAWAQVQEARDAGLTPDEALALVLA